jgi:methionine--tRNA ligase beta chain
LSDIVLPFEEFKKIELRTAKVTAAERVAGSEKLLRLTLDDGTPDGRIILAGIGKSYEPESLPGRSIVIVANLEPRALMGQTSNGMMLAAHDADGAPVLLVPERDAPPGAAIS